MEIDNELAFRTFRPHCMELVKCPDKATLEKLELLCSCADPAILTALQEYLIFPQQLYLKNPTKPTNYTISVIRFISKFYKRAVLNQGFILKDVLTAMLGVLSSVEKQATPDEDLKLAVCECSADLISSAEDEILDQLYSESMKLVISHLVYSSLSWALEEKFPNLRSSSLHLLSILVEKRNQDFHQIFQTLLPGILSKLAKLCQDPQLIQSSIKAQAIRVWSAYTGQLFTDDRRGCFAQDWCVNAQNQILAQMRIFQGFSSHSDYRIREALLACAETIISNCWDILENSRFIVLNLLVISSLSDEPKIRSRSLQLIGQFVDKFSDIQALSSEVNKKLIQASKDIGSCLGLYSDKILEQNLSLVLGHLTFLKQIESNSSFFISKVHLSVLIQSLVRVSQFSEAQTPVFGSETPRGSSWDYSNFNFLFSPQYYLSGDRPGKSYRYLTTPRLENLLEKVCKILGRMESFPAILECLLEGVEELSYLKKEAMHVLNLVILGREGSGVADLDEAFDTCLPVIHNYLESTGVSVHNAVAVLESEPTPKIVPSNVWTEFLLSMEGMGAMGRVFGKRLRSLHSEMILFCISNTSMVDPLGAHVLFYALQDLADGNSQTIQELLASNIDHLSKDLNLLLRQRKTSSPGISTLIRLALKISPSNQDKEDLYDTMESLVVNLATSEEQQTLEILNLVRIFVAGYRDIFCCEPESARGDRWPEEEEEEGLITSLVQDWERKRSEELADTEELLNCPEQGFHQQQNDNQDENEDLRMEEEENKELNLDQKFLKTVLEHVRHFVSMTKKPNWQIAALDSVAICIDLLAKTPGQHPGERQEAILPLVHQVWSPLHLLFKSNNIFIVDKAFDCLCIIARHAREFVHRRTVTDVFPPLVNFFRMLEIMVKDRDKMNTLAANQSRRILVKLVDGIWELLELLDLAPLETDPILQMLIEHLQDKLGFGDTKQFFKPKRSVDANILDLKFDLYRDADT